jgi:hypothetical protein
VTTDPADRLAVIGPACDAAEQVLALFESVSPGDDRPRRAIEAGRAWARGEVSVGAARNAALAAHAAARDCTDDAGTMAARAAGHAAATAHVAAHASHAQDYAARAQALSRTRGDSA